MRRHAQNIFFIVVSATIIGGVVFFILKALEIL